MAYPSPAGLRLDTPGGRRKYLNPEERRRFLAAADRADPDLWAFCHVLAWTGCRLSEALGLAPADLDASTGSVTIRSLKKRGQAHMREVPVPHALAAQLAALPTCGGAFWRWGRTTAWRYVIPTVVENDLWFRSQIFAKPLA